MYVIFPADEVVYLSYGRLIYVPTARAPEFPTQLLQHISDPTTTAQPIFNSSSSGNCPSPSIPSTGSSNRSFRSTHSAPISNGFPEEDYPGSSNPTSTPVRPERTKGKQLPKNQSESSLLKLNSKAQPAKDLFLQVPKPRTGNDKRLSYSDFLPVHKCLKDGQKSDSAKSGKRGKSPNFDELFKREATPTRGILRTPSQTDPPTSESRLQLSGLQLSPGGCARRDLSAGLQLWQSVKPNAQTSGVQQKSPTKKKPFFSASPKPEPRIKRTSEVGFAKMATSDASALKDLTHPTYNEHLKGHNGVTFKLIRTVSDFTQQLSQMYEQHASELQHLVASFRKKNGELRKERPACPSTLFHTWETLLQEVELDSQALGDIASILGRQVSRPLLEKSFYRKIQSRKVFTHRESYETIIAKTEEKLTKCRQEYKNAYLHYLANPTTDTLSEYFNSHNAYVQQLHATNGMLEEYNKETLPQLLQELEEIYTDLCTTLTEAVLQGAEVVSARAMEQCRRYDGLVSQSKTVNSSGDLVHLARALPVPQGRPPILRRLFVPPQPPPPPETEGEEAASHHHNENIPPPLKDELVIDRLSALQVKPSHDALRKEAGDLEAQIRQIHDALDTLVRLQQRSVEASLFNKANEIQEDISMKRFDLRVAQIHLSAINAQKKLYTVLDKKVSSPDTANAVLGRYAGSYFTQPRQKELFSNKLDTGDSGRERKMSNASQGSMKTKWLKAFKSLKTPPPENEKKNGAAATKELLKGDPDAHNFQEYTYKKITPCDICSQVLRGHTRQGLKCRICKMNVHVDCQEKASKCQAKARLLRRQKSTSEIETRVPETTVEEEKSPEVDLIYQVLKQAGEISNKTSSTSSSRTEPTIGITVDRGATATPSGSGQNLNRRGIVGPPLQPPRTQGANLCVINPAPCSTSSDRRPGQGPSSSESSMRRRIFAGMKSLTGFGSRSRQGSPGHRSISLPETPHSPRRQKLNLRMKSLSLDSPESTEHVQRRKHHGAAATSDPHSNQSSSSRIQSPSSPVHNRRLLSAKNIRMSSVELPDDNEKSPSSASTSPCPSPVGGKKSHRLLPTNLYVVLYNFKSRHQDELDLKAGYKVTVIDTSDPDWWKGKCLGRIGYFPSKYCSKLSPGEKPLQVTHNLQVSDGDNGLMLLRDQIVIQIGEELDGMVMIRSGDNRQGVCPVKFLQEV